mmetsp:Transcript_827/g.1113  ORF Transcript_827/g.1113 Transcript_827/m.1113 type:complete len:370 (-) Transcript_827:63-1172(-)
MAQQRSSLLPCQVCNKEIAIYCCPRCHMRTCSLECCRKHKTKDESTGELVCNGQRDRTKFCSLKGFTDAQLASDYHFLEDVMSTSSSSKRLYQSIVSGDSTKVMTDTKRVKATSFNTKRTAMVEIASMTSSAPVHPLLQATKGKSTIDILASEVREVDFEDDANIDKQDSSQKSNAINSLLGNKQQRSAATTGKKKEAVDHLTRQAELGGIFLLRMPQGMGRRASNTTKFSKKSGITWKIEFNFHYPSNAAIASQEISENKLPKFLRVESEMNENSTWLEALGKHLDVHPGNSAIRSQLKMFANTRRESLVLLMKRLPCSAAAPQYLQFDSNATLKDSLKAKTVIEFPTVEVIFEEDRGRFPLFIGVVS